VGSADFPIFEVHQTIQLRTSLEIKSRSKLSSSALAGCAHDVTEGVAVNWTDGIEEVLAARRSPVVPIEEIEELGSQLQAILAVSAELLVLEKTRVLAVGAVEFPVAE
jgi:hypothetical protein